MSLNLENYLSCVAEGGLNTAKDVSFTGTNCALPAATTIGGSSVAALGNITSSSADAFDVGLNGSTNPAFNVDCSTGSQAAGIKVKGATAAGNVAISVISSGVAANLLVDALGTGTVTINGTATGNIVLGRAATGVSLSATGLVTSRSATAVAAAASVTPAFLTSSTALLGFYFGTGDPNTALTAAKGSLYMRTDGSSSSTRAYVNTDGATAWAAVTTAS